MSPLRRLSPLILAAGACTFSASSLTAAPPVIAAKYKHRIERNVLIPMRDGVLLSADLIRPDVADDVKLPILIEYIPYRKDDAARGAHDGHIYLAGRGFIGVRLDVRGTGGARDGPFSKTISASFTAKATFAARPARRTRRRRASSARTPSRSRERTTPTL